MAVRPGRKDRRHLSRPGEYIASQKARSRRSIAPQQACLRGIPPQSIASRARVGRYSALMSPDLQLEIEPTVSR